MPGRHPSARRPRHLSTAGGAGRQASAGLRGQAATPPLCLSVLAYEAGASTWGPCRHLTNARALRMPQAWKEGRFSVNSIFPCRGPGLPLVFEMSLL